MSDRFDELVDDPRLGNEERERLRRVHDLLVTVGPPPEASAHLQPPSVGTVVPLRRRSRPFLLIAAALAVAAAGGAGYAIGRGGSEEAAPAVTTAPPPATTQPPVTTPPPATTQTQPPPPPRGTVVPMTGVGSASGALATVELLPRASSGDYPVRLRVEGLAANEVYELWVIDDGELEQLCGRFRTTRGITDTILTVPYEMRTRDDWVVVRPGTAEPLLRT
jgi:hypothetical protein